MLKSSWWPVKWPCSGHGVLNLKQSPTEPFQPNVGFNCPTHSVCARAFVRLGGAGAPFPSHAPQSFATHHDVRTMYGAGYGGRQAVFSLHFAFFCWLFLGPYTLGGAHIKRPPPSVSKDGEGSAQCDKRPGCGGLGVARGTGGLR